MDDLKKLQAEDLTLAQVIQAADWSASDKNESVVRVSCTKDGHQGTPRERNSTTQGGTVGVTKAL